MEHQCTDFNHFDDEDHNDILCVIHVTRSVRLSATVSTLFEHGVHSVLDWIGI